MCSSNRAFMCAMFKVFIASISHHKIRAQPVPFKPVATCHLWISTLKWTEEKTTVQVLNCTHHTSCAQEPHVANSDGGVTEQWPHRQCGSQKCPIIAESSIRRMVLAKLFLIEINCHGRHFFHRTFPQINSDLEWSTASYSQKTYRSSPPEEASSNSNHQ